MFLAEVVMIVSDRQNMIVLKLTLLITCSQLFGAIDAVDRMCVLCSLRLFLSGSANVKKKQKRQTDRNNVQYTSAPATIEVQVVGLHVIY